MTRGAFPTAGWLLPILALAVATPSAAEAQDTGWTILSFEVDYIVHPDRSIGVVERITVDFGRLKRHGIYRDIPVRYHRLGPGGVGAGRVTVGLDVERVTNGAGREWPVQVTRGDEVRIRIGDPNRTVSGWQTYEIHYTLSGGLGFFEEHDELYWQVTGTRWPVPIASAEATVTLPAAAVRAHQGNEPWAARCFAGWAESTNEERCTAEVVSAGRYRFSVGRLEPGEGLTLVAAFPKAVIEPPTAAERAAAWLWRYGPLGLPLATFAILLALWSRRGREPSAGSVVPRWRVPDGIRPGPAGTLVDQKADMDDVVATILDLAVRGHVRIREISPEGLLGGVDQDSFAGRALRAIGLMDKDWRLERLDADPTELVRHEHQVLQGIFEGRDSRRMSELHNDFYEHLPEIREALYEQVVRKGLFPRRPDSTRKRYLFAGIGIAILGAVFGPWSGNLVLAVGLVLSGLVVVLFSFVMPAMTLKGARLRRDLLGLEEYIRRAEKAELEFREAPEKTPGRFSEILPYAVALDVSDIWARQFEDVLRSSPPTWYVGSHGGWDGAGFRSGLTGFRSAATKTLGSAPGSSSGMGGGGSVGGGGGGGGGGSW